MSDKPVRNWTEEEKVYQAATKIAELFLALEDAAIIIRRLSSPQGYVAPRYVDKEAWLEKWSKNA